MTSVARRYNSLLSFEENNLVLGLSIAKELIALQKGTLELLDTPGGGCTFRVALN